MAKPKWLSATRPIIARSSSFGGALSGTADVSDRARWIITGELTGDKFGFSVERRRPRHRWHRRSDHRRTQHNVTNHPPNFADAGAVYVFYGVPPPTPTQVVSRKLHSGVPFDINLPFTGGPGIECRSGGATNDYRLFSPFPTPSLSVSRLRQRNGNGRQQQRQRDNYSHC